MSAYHAALLDFAGADEEFVTEQLSATELSTKVEELAGKEYEPDIAEEDYQREGICYVLILYYRTSGCGWGISHRFLMKKFRSAHRWRRNSVRKQRKQGI